MRPSIGNREFRADQSCFPYERIYLQAKRMIFECPTLKILRSSINLFVWTKKKKKRPAPYVPHMAVKVLEQGNRNGMWVCSCIGSYTLRGGRKGALVLGPSTSARTDGLTPIVKRQPYYVKAVYDNFDIQAA